MEIYEGILLSVLSVLRTAYILEHIDKSRVDSFYVNFVTIKLSIYLCI